MEDNVLAMEGKKIEFLQPTLTPQSIEIGEKTCSCHLDRFLRGSY
jgi:hypothetical protein